jgi:hypothetical protein
MKGAAGFGGGVTKQRTATTAEAVLERTTLWLETQVGTNQAVYPAVAELGVSALSGSAVKADARELATPARTREALSKIPFSAVDEVAQLVLETLTGHAFSYEEASSPDAKRIIETLRVRDSIEVLLEGARSVLGDDLGLEDEAMASLMSFEQLVRPEIWRLVPLNEVRAASLEWLKPERRRDFWWWADGVDVPPDALDGLSAAAHVLERFPGAGAELERLRAAQKVLDKARKDK